MTITNPTKETVKIQIDGIVYEVEPESSISNVPAEHAEKWIKTHAFLEVGSEGKVKVTEPEPEESKEEKKPAVRKVTKKTTKK